MRGGILGLLLFLICEALIFHTGWYSRYLEPESSAAELALHLTWLRENPPPSDWKQIAVVGDSRIAEGFSGRLASELPGSARNYYWSFGLHGTTPRVWYYFLRDGDPRQNRFSAIVLAMNRYSDQDSFDPDSGRISDLNFAVNQLRLTDAWEFSRSMPSPAYQRTALVGTLFKGWTLRNDAQDFLSNVPARLEKARLARAKGYGYEWGYEGVPTDLRGLSLSPDLTFPPSLNDAQKSTIRDTVTPHFAPHTGDLTRYRTLWFNKILARYRGTKTKIIFVQLPRGPLHPVAPPFPSPFIDSVRLQPNVIVVPPQTFEDLESPENFFDGLHMNRTGREIFSKRLAGIVNQELSHP